MMLVRRRGVFALLATAAMTLGVLGGSVGAARADYDPANPPYPVDVNNVTSLTIYDVTTGAIVNGGSTATALNNYYFVAATDFSPGHRKAIVQGFLAVANKQPGEFPGAGLGAATTYPATSAPAPVSSATTPTAKGSSTSTFGDLADAYPNVAGPSSDFFELYQLRVLTTFPTPQSDAYAFADIQIDPTAGTWHQVNPAPDNTTAPGAPTIGTATAGDGSATVSFTAPADDGGASISGYTVTSSPGGVMSTGTTSPVTVSGLTNGTPYSFTVKATNSKGTSPDSAASNQVTPTAPTAPGAPTAVTATAGNGGATVSFTAPASDGGSAITNYTVTSAPGGVVANGSSSPVTLTGLTNGVTYTFTVQGTNILGTGPDSLASNAVTPAAPTAPTAPTIGTVTPGNTTARVAFSAPASDGGSAVTSYTATATPGGQTATGAGSPLTVTGLTNGVTYTFTVKATNAVGTGPESAPSAAMAPVATRTALSLTVPANVISGHIYRATGRLVGGAVGSKTIVIKVVTSGGSTRYAHVTTTSSGIFAYAVKPTYSTTLTAGFAGSPTQTRSSSVARRTIAHVVVSVTSPRSGLVCRKTCSVTFKGRVSPVHSGNKLGVYTKGGSRVVGGSLKGNGTYTLTHTFKRGTYYLHVYAFATTNNGSGSSGTVKVTVH